MPHHRPRTPVLLAAAISLALLTACGEQATSTAEDDGSWEPSEPIDYIAPAASGGGWDTLARTTGRVLEQSDLVDQPFPVENREGGGGAVGWAYVAQRSGDNHTLFMASPPVILVPMSGEADHDHTDFTPIARLITDYMIYLVPDDSPISTVGELLEQAGTGAISVAGGSAPGSMDHIALAGAADAAGADPTQVNYVPFSGGGEAMTAAIGGHVDAVVTGAGESISQVESGQLRALATSAPAGESPVDAPALADEGIDFEFDVWRGIMGPADMDPAALAYYEQLYADMLELDEWASERDSLGWIDAYMDADEFSGFLDEQAETFETILDDLGLLGQAPEA